MKTKGNIEAKINFKIIFSVTNVNKENEFCIFDAKKIPFNKFINSKHIKIY